MGISLGSLVSLAGGFIPGGAGQAVGALGALLGSSGGGGNAMLGESARARQGALAELLKGIDGYDKAVQGMNLSPDGQVDALRKYADYYQKLNAKNAVATTGISGMMRSSDPGQMFREQTQGNANQFALQEQALRDAAVARELGVAGEKANQRGAVASLLSGQSGQLLNAGLQANEMQDRRYAGGIAGLMQSLAGPEASSYLQGRLGIKTGPQTGPQWSNSGQVMRYGNSGGGNSGGGGNYAGGAVANALSSVMRAKPKQELYGRVAKGLQGLRF
jgi:hypothetical protein